MGKRAVVLTSSDAGGEPEKEPRGPRRGARRWLNAALPALTLLVGIALTAFAVWASANDVSEERDRIAVDRGTASVRSQVDGYAEVLLGVRGLFGASQVVERDEFAAFLEAGAYQERFPGILGTQWAPVVRGPDLAAFIADQRRRGRVERRQELIDYTVHPEASRPIHYPIQYLHPLPDPTVLGLDLAFERSRREGIERARDSGRRLATAPIELVEGGRGLLILEPINTPDVAAAGCLRDPSERCIELRREGFRGVAAGVFRARDMLGGLQSEGLSFSVNDRGSIDAPPTDPVPLFTAPDSARTAHEPITMEVFGRRWEIIFHSLGEVSAPGIPPWIIGVLGIAITLALTSVAYLGMTARRRAENLAVELTTDLGELNERLRVSNHDLQQFAYVASHDLQTPIRNMRQIAELLNEDIEAGELEQLSEHADYLEAAGERAEALIQGLLDFSRVQAADLSFVAVDTTEMTRSVVADLSEDIDESGGSVVVEELPVVAGDPVLLRQVVANLILNGLKYRDPDRPAEVRVSGEAAPDGITIHVEDNGLGIEERFHARIFEIFRRLQRQDEISGSGIGLSLAKRVIDKHGGEIWVSSEPGVGSTFSFRIPRHPADGAAASRPERSQAPVAVERE